MRNMETFARKDFYHFFHGANPVAINILERMLDLDKDNRPSATEALAHEYFAQFHDPSDEPTAEPFDDEFEKMDLQLNEWKGKKIWPYSAWTEGLECILSVTLLMQKIVGTVWCTVIS